VNTELLYEAEQIDEDRLYNPFVFWRKNREELEDDFSEFLGRMRYPFRVMFVTVVPCLVI